MLKPRYLVTLTAALLATTGSVSAAEYFNRFASFPVALNNPDAEAGAENSAEIITATGKLAMRLKYSAAVTEPVVASKAAVSVTR